MATIMTRSGSQDVVGGQFTDHVDTSMEASDAETCAMCGAEIEVFDFRNTAWPIQLRCLV